MRKTNDMPKRFLATFLAIVLAYGNAPIQVAYGVEAAKSAEPQTTSSDVATQAEDDAEPVAGEAADSSAAGTTEESVVTDDTDDAKNATSQSDDADAGESPAATSGDEGAEAATTETQAEATEPYSIKVTFGDDELKEGENTLGTWSDGAKALNITLVRNTGVPVDANKTYVLSMSVPDVLYFNGIPKAGDITGVEEVSFKKNATPQVISSRNARGNYSDFSTNSGEIRMRLNTQVNQMEVNSLGVSFDPKLVGYKTVNDLANALDVKVLAVDASTGLNYGSSSAADVLLERAVSHITMENKLEVSSNAGQNSSTRTYVSNDGFVNDSNRINKDIEISKTGSVSFALGPNGLTPQVYGKLTLVYHCPYILDSNNQQHFLSFDRNDSSITSNSQGSATGLHLDSPAIVNEADHTITYTFTDVLTAYWIPVLMVTPKFSWPEDMGDASDDGTYAVVSEGWTVTEQKSYLGADSTLLIANANRTIKPFSSATFVSDSVDLRLRSSSEATWLSKFKPYAAAQDGGVTGGLGFFDLHNLGVADSKPVNIRFKFNTESTGAKYHVTQVNLPVDGNTEGTTVSFVLSNGSQTVSGSKTYDASTVPKGTAPYISCKATYLRTAAGLDQNSDYYIEEISYVSNTLKGGFIYHSEVVDSSNGSYYTKDPGLFFGWISGDVGTTAKASMTIESVDGASALTKNGEATITSTEVATVSDDNSTAITMNPLTLDSGKSVNLTAGQSSTIRYAVALQDTERAVNGAVNGYHVMENPVLYVCLPIGVSIAGTDQGTLSFSRKSVKATKVSVLDGSTCTVGGTEAQWWAVEFDGANMVGSGTISVQLSTSRTMGAVIWDFNNAAAIRAKGQFLKAASSSTCGSDKINKVTDLTSASRPAAIQKLGSALSDDQYANDKLGLVYYKYAEGRILNISRAEAKLDVATSLAQEGQTAAAGESIRVTDENATLDYDVNVSSSEGGSAKDFSYYIPIVKAGATLDVSAFTTASDYSLKLGGEVAITGENEGGTPLTRMPFDVLYTTEPNLTSSNIQTLDAGKWQKADAFNGNFSQVTAVKIVTNVDGDGNPSTIWDGSSFKFELKLAYDNAGNDFAANAGRTVAWRTFGHYTYTRNGAQTTNTYPSGANSVKLGYVSDRTSTPIDVTLDTSTGAQGTATLDLGQAFNTDRTLKIKNVTPKNLNLTGDNPSGYAGTKANDTFRIALGLNGQTKRSLSDGAGGSYGIAKGDSLSTDVKVDFSTALTNASTPRWVDVTIGDDDIDITVRLNLARVVKPADAKSAGVAVGENYNTTQVSDSVTIASNSAFSALFPVSGFVPANYSAQKLKWKDSTGKAANIPNGTTIIMVGLKDDNTPESYWLYRSTGAESEVNLTEFKSMDTGKAFSYDTKSVVSTSLKYLFVVNFADTIAANGSYKIAFGADAVAGAAAFSDVEKDVTVVSPGTYSLDVSDSQLTYGVNASAGNESYLERKSLSLVLTPAAGSSLPADAKLSDGTNEYARNTKGEFVVPLGTVASGSKSFSVVSKQLPSGGGSYTFDARLMLVGTTVDASPDAGSQVATASLTLSTASSPSPSLSVTGTRVATVAEWKGGQQFNLSVAGLDGCSLTVTVYRGLTGNDKVTDLLSSVGGCFDLKDGVGTYNGGASTGKLQLSSEAKPGTYRLVFEVKDAGGNELAEVPYAIIVR